MPRSPFSLNLPDGRQLQFSSQQEAQSFFERIALSEHLGKIISPESASILQSHSSSLRNQASEIPQMIAELEKTVRDGKRDATLGQVGSVFDGALSWVDTLAEGGKIAPNPIAQVAGRTWLASTQGTKSVMAAFSDRPSDASENALAALSQVPGLGSLDKGKKVLGAFNNGYDAGESLQAGSYDAAAAQVVKGVAEGITPDVAGSAVQSTANSYLKGKEFAEMSDLKTSLDRTLESGKANYQKLDTLLNTRADTNDVYATLAEQGRGQEVSQLMEAFKKQMPEVVQQAENGNLKTLLNDATEVARKNTVAAYRKEAPERLAEFQSQQEKLDVPTATLEPTPAAEKTLYWSDPKDKDGFVNLRDPEGNYQRMPLEKAIEQKLIPEGTTLNDMTEYDASADSFTANKPDTSDRFGQSREERIEGTTYPENGTLPGWRGDSPATPVPYADTTATPPISSPLAPGENPTAETLPNITPATDSEILRKSGGAQWFDPGGDGSILGGPTYQNWGGGGWNGGVRDDTPICRPDWLPPNDKMDEAFRDHDYDYMRHGLSADTPNTNPFKRQADLDLLQKLKRIPDSELDADSLLFKTTTELYFSEATSGEYPPELVEKLRNMSLGDLSFEEKIAKIVAQLQIRKSEAADLLGNIYDGAKEKVSDGLDYLGDKANSFKDSIFGGNDDATSPTVLDDFAGGSSGLQSLSSSSSGGQSITEAEDDADTGADNADRHADRAAIAANNARSAARRAAASAARMRTLLSRKRF